MTHLNTGIEGTKWDFCPTSVILCHIIVGAAAYVETKCVESKSAECTKKDPCKILAIGSKFLSSSRIYSRVFRHRNTILIYFFFWTHPASTTRICFPACGAELNVCHRSAIAPTAQYEARFVFI
jgi:hypothetical protein